jgi:hypothetical protein
MENGALRRVEEEIVVGLKSGLFVGEFVSGDLELDCMEVPVVAAEVVGIEPWIGSCA